MSAKLHPGGTIKASAVFMATALTLMVLSILAPRPADANHVGNFIINTRSGLVADVLAGSTDNGQDVVLYPKTRGLNQQFDFRDMGGGRVEIVARHSGKCLDVYGWSLADGGPVVQWDCHGGNNQLWLLRIMVNPGVCPPFGCATVGTKFVSVHSGKCIDAANGSFPNPPGQWARLQQWGCANTTGDPWWVNQTWTSDNEHGPH
jgi:hypothetical protein